MAAREARLRAATNSILKILRELAVENVKKVEEKEVMRNVMSTREPFILWGDVEKLTTRDHGTGTDTWQLSTAH